MTTIIKPDGLTDAECCEHCRFYRVQSRDDHNVYICDKFNYWIDPIQVCNSFKERENNG